MSGNVHRSRCRDQFGLMRQIGRRPNLRIETERRAGVLTLRRREWLGTDQRGMEERGMAIALGVGGRRIMPTVVDPTLGRDTGALPPELFFLSGAVVLLLLARAR
jgi:hypothetical protein